MDAPTAVHDDPANPPDGTAQQARHLRTLVRLRAMVVLGLVLPTLAYAVVAVVLYDRELAETRVRLDSLSRIAAEHALKLFDTNEMLLQRIADLTENRPDAQLLQDGAELHARLKRMASGLPQVQGLFVFGAESHMLANSRSDPPPRQIDYSDRAWFQAHLRGDEPTYFTEQIVSRLTGEAAFDMSHRRVQADGSFAGTVHVSLRPEYLTDFYKELGTTEPGLRVAVLRKDGAVIARWAGDGSQAGSGPVAALKATDPLMLQIAAGRPVGQSDGVSPWDGTPQLRTFRQLGRYPLYVVASINRSAIVAEWRKSALLLAGFVFPTAIGFAWMAWIAVRRTREEFDSVQNLADEKARRQRAELGLLQAQKLEAIGRLTGGVAHDFNNLLSVVGNSLEVLRRLRPELAATRQVEAIDRAVAAGAKLTRQLLAFTRKQALLPERVRLQERLGLITELLRPLLGAAITLEWSVAEDTAPIEVDVAELELALINLAVNAADAMEGRGRLTIVARNALDAERPEGAQGDFVLIELTDTGPGIDAAAGARAFEPFFTTKPLGKGTGLGLSQVRSLCQSAGGDASIGRAPAGGTRVRLLLRGAAEAAGAPARAAPTTAAVLTARVLLVEDNDEVARATSELLTALGCPTRRVPGGDAARRFVEAQASSIDVVLSDIEMPGGIDGIDGIALALHLREHHPALPVILMTGYTTRLDEAVRQGLAVLPKPCSATLLSDAIARALARPRAAAAAP